MRAHFITLEGIDGAGKSTHLAWLADHLRARGVTVCITREPGGTALGEKLRALLLASGQGMHRETESLLMFAARREHLARVIEPALQRGEWVVCDRFTDATFAYQGSGRGVDWAKLRTLEQWVQGTLKPDLTLLFDVAPDVGRSRARSIKAPDRFEQEESAFFDRVREGYLRRAREDASRVHAIDASRSVTDIQREIARVVEPLCR